MFPVCGWFILRAFHVLWDSSLLDVRRKRTASLLSLMKTMWSRHVYICCRPRLFLWILNCSSLSVKEIHMRKGNFYIGTLRSCVLRLQRKWILTVSEACQSFFLCSSGTFSHVLSEWPNPWAPGSFALERSTDVGMKRWVEEPNHNSSMRSLPSAPCRVCSPHELGKMLPEHCSHPPGSFCGFPDVELMQVT